MSDVYRSHEAHERLTLLTVEMTKPLDAPENSDVKAIIFLSDEKRGGIQLHGYRDDMEAMVELFVHMKMVFQANGKDLDFLAVPNSPEGIEDV